MHLHGLAAEVWENIYDFLSFRSRLYRGEIMDLEDMSFRYDRDAMIAHLQGQMSFRWKRAAIDHYYSMEPHPLLEIPRSLPMKLFRDMIATMHRSKLPVISRDHIRYRPCGLPPIRKRVGILAYQDRFVYVCENIHTGTIRIL